MVEQIRAEFYVAGVIACLCLADAVLNGGHALMFLMAKLFDGMEFLAFWRH